MKHLLMACALLIGVQGYTAETYFDAASEVQAQVISAQIAEGRALDWKVGDANNYKLNIGGFINGTMVMKVRENTADGIWVDQDMDLAGQKQKIEMLFDASSGAVKKVIANGKEQSIPENDSEIESVTQEKITVAAGTFDCLHAVLKNKKDNSKTDAWVNPQVIPISGALKMISPSQFGKVTMELNSYKKN